MRLKKQVGFTLIELLVAMAIFSSMTVMAYGALSNIFKSNEVLESKEIKLKALKRTMLFLERDLRQMALRPKNNGYGQGVEAAFITSQSSENRLEFSRAGNATYLDKAQSSLQRVRYRLEDGILKRMSWNIIDHLESKPVTINLLNDVDEFSLRFLGDTWKDTWESNNKIPRAIEITLIHKMWGKIIRLIPFE